MIIKVIKRIINISDSKTINNKERYAKRFKAKDVFIRGKTLLKIRNASHIIAVKGLTNRVLKLKPKLKPPRL